MPEFEQSTVSRRKRILELLNENGIIYIEQLSQQFEVSDVTIRKDLDRLEQKNLLVRARGGAIKTNPVGFDQHLAEKNKLNHVQKTFIGRRAAALIQNNETVIIDSGSTTFEMIQNLNHLNSLTVVTNALNIATRIMHYSNINLIIPGGNLRNNMLSLVGPIAEKSFMSFNVDKVFLGVDAFDTRKGIFTPSPEEARLNEIMIDIAKEVIVVADSSKFSRRSFAFICPVNKIHKVITDSGISAEDSKRLDDNGVEIIIAK